MNFNEKLVDIILNERHDGDKDIDWLYGEYVKRGYNKSTEMFCEEFVKNMGGQDTNDLTELEANQVAGGADKFIKRGASVGLAAALLAGPMTPTQGAGVTESRAVVSDNISTRKQVKSKQGFAELAEGFIRKVFNDADVRNVLMPVLATVGVPVLGAGTIYLIIRIVKRISEAKTPEEVLQDTAEAIGDIITKNEENANKDTILTTLRACLLKLITFVTRDQQRDIREKFESQFGKEDKPKVFTNWIGLQQAFTEVLSAITKVLKLETENNPFGELFEERTGDFAAIFGNGKGTDKQDQTEKQEHEEEKSILTAIFAAKEQNGKISKDQKHEDEDENKEEEEESKEEPQEEPKEEHENSVLLPNCDSIFDSTYDVTTTHDSYATDKLKDNKIVSKETGIKKDVLDVVDNFVKQKSERISYTNVGENSVLVACKNMTLDRNFRSEITNISEKTGRNNLYLVLENCTVNHTDLPDGTNIKVLDLRGNTVFPKCLLNAGTVEKVLIRSNIRNTGYKLWLHRCKKLGPIYLLSDENTRNDNHPLFLSSCHLAENFKFVNLNSCCTKLLDKWRLNLCQCPATSRNTILENFAKESQPNEEQLRGV